MKKIEVSWTGGDEGSGVYTPYGAVRDAFRCMDSEVVLAGPADTGKTLGLLYKIHQIAHKYPNAQICMVRKQQVDIYSTVWQTYSKKIIDPLDGLTIYGGSKPTWVGYPNDSRIWIAGLDKPGKVLSGEFDIVYVNQTEQLTLTDWEILTTRTSGRAGNVPYSQVIGDANPAHPSHWIKQRARDGKLTLIESTHRDNPELFNPKSGDITPEGLKRIGSLENLSGARKQRLLMGLWVEAEGAIYDVFQEERHVCKSFNPPVIWPRIVAIDPIGAYTCALWGAFDPGNGVLNIYREYYKPFGQTTPGHVKNILELSLGEYVIAWVGGGPSENQARLDFQGAGLPLMEPPDIGVEPGIDRIYQLLKEPAIFIHDTCQNLISEFGSYRRKLKNDQVTEGIEDKESFHCLDTLRYMVAWITEIPSQQTSVVPIRERLEWY